MAADIGIISRKLINYRHSTEHFSHNYHKLRTDKDNGLAVFESYYNKHKAILSDQDRKNFKFYQFKDNVHRALNYSVQKHPREARELFGDIFDKEIMDEGIRKLGNIKSYLRGLILYFSLKLNFSYMVAKWFKI